MREKVREVNDRYREAICAQLSAEDAARVRKAALSAAYDRVYRSNPVERAFEAALQIEGLDAGVVDSLKALEQQYGTELSPLNDRIAQALRKEEPVQQTEDMVRIVGFMTGDVPMSQMFRGQGGGNAQAESRKLLDDRNTMNDKYMERIKALLTPEQYESLPKQRGDRAGMGNVFAGGGPIKLSDLPQQAQERMKEFDKNNDGTIDDTERAAMVESFRQRGFPGGGGMMFGGGGGQPQDAQGGNGQGGRRGNRGNRGGNGQGGDAPQN
jgi:hypothetical protein